ncbi:MAG: hypothetical protein L0Y56_03810, partial [Nitrospira sp.]|nr:hypothetical protein [Nitrospira sp.]
RVAPGRDGPACGTIACIAGWTYILGKGLDPKKVSQRDLYENAGDEATKLLGLSPNQCKRLFSETLYEHWGGFAVAYNAARTPLERAKVAAARIEHFIETGGRE